MARGSSPEGSLGPLTAAPCWKDRLTLSCWTVAAFLVLTLCGQSVQAYMSDCGGHIDLGKGTVTFYSPNYPNSYPEGSYCIWIITAARDYRVGITFTFNGDEYLGNCADYLEIRDGGPASTILGTYCDASHTNVQLKSSNIWMFVLLRTDQIVPATNPATMVVTASAVFNSTPVAAITNQVPDCRSYQFECPNLMCISMSYRCDAYNDCGCLDGCDEDGCGSLPISLDAQIGISVAVGVVLLAFICFLTHLFEGRNAWMGSKDDASRERELQKQDQRRRATRNYSKFIGPGDKSNLMLFDKSASNKAGQGAKVEASPRFDSTLKITDC